MLYSELDFSEVIKEAPIILPDFPMTTIRFGANREIIKEPYTHSKYYNNFFEDNYEEGLTTNRVIQYTMSFTMKTYFFGPVYSGGIITQVIERDYIGDNSNTFTTTNISSSGLVKEVKHYEPAFSAVSNAVSSSTTITFDTAINSSISVNDEVFGTNLSTNPTVSSIAADKLSIVVSSAVTLDDETTLKFVGSVNPNDTFVVAETVTFYDEGTASTYSEDLISDA